MLKLAWLKIVHQHIQLFSKSSSIRTLDISMLQSSVKITIEILQVAGEKRWKELLLMYLEMMETTSSHHFYTVKCNKNIVYIIRLFLGPK